MWYKMENFNRNSFDVATMKSISIKEQIEMRKESMHAEQFRICK